MSVENEAASAAVKLGVDLVGGVARAAIPLATEAMKSLANIVATIPKNTAAFVQALMTRTDSAGRVNIARVLQGGERPMIFELNSEQYAQFKREAKNYGITYSTYTDKTTPGTDVICRASQAELVDHLLQKIGVGQVSLVDETQTPTTLQDVAEAKLSPDLEAVGRVEYLRDGRVIFSEECPNAATLSEVLEASADATESFNVVLYNDSEGRHLDIEPMMEGMKNPEIVSVSYEAAPERVPEPERTSPEAFTEADELAADTALVGRIEYLDEQGEVNASLSFNNPEELAAVARSDAWFADAAEKSNIVLYHTADDSHFVVYNQIAADIDNERTSVTYENAPREAVAVGIGGVEAAAEQQPVGRLVYFDGADAAEAKHAEARAAQPVNIPVPDYDAAGSAIPPPPEGAPVIGHVEFFGEQGKISSFVECRSAEELVATANLSEKSNVMIYRAKDDSHLNLYVLVSSQLAQRTSFEDAPPHIIKQRAQSAKTAAAQTAPKPRRNAREMIAAAKVKLAEGAAAKAQTKGKTAATTRAQAPERR